MQIHDDSSRFKTMTSSVAETSKDIIWAIVTHHVDSIFMSNYFADVIDALSKNQLLLEKLITFVLKSEQSKIVRIFL